jgi:hypothetical protein
MLVRTSNWCAASWYQLVVCHMSPHRAVLLPVFVAGAGVPTVWGRHHCPVCNSALDHTGGHREAGDSLHSCTRACGQQHHCCSSAGRSIGRVDCTCVCVTAGASGYTSQALPCSWSLSSLVSILACAGRGGAGAVCLFRGLAGPWPLGAQRQPGRRQGLGCCSVQAVRGEWGAFESKDSYVVASQFAPCH